MILRAPNSPKFFPTFCAIATVRNTKRKWRFACSGYHEEGCFDHRSSNMGEPMSCAEIHITIVNAITCPMCSESRSCCSCPHLAEARCANHFNDSGISTIPQPRTFPVLIWYIDWVFPECHRILYEIANFREG